MGEVIESRPHPRGLSSFVKTGAIVLGLAFTGIGIYILAIQLNFTTQESSDFFPYYNMARNLMSGKSIYTDFSMQSPFLALLVTPFAILPYKEAAIAWALFSILCYVGILWIIQKELKLELQRAWKILLFGLLLCWYPFLSHISLGQLSLFVGLILYLAWANLRNEKNLLGGFLIGIAVLVKLYPGALLIYLLARKKWKATLAVVTAVAIGLAFLAITVGTDDVLYYFFEVVPNQSNEFILYPINFSINGIISRTFTDNPWVKPLFDAPQLGSILRIAASGFITLLAFLHIWKAGPSKRAEDFSFALALIAMLLLSPITWLHAAPILLLGFALIWKELAHQRKSRLRTAALFSLLLLSLPDLYIATILLELYFPQPVPYHTAAILVGPFVALTVLWIVLSRFMNHIRYCEVYSYQDFYQNDLQSNHPPCK